MVAQADFSALTVENHETQIPDLKWAAVDVSEVVEKDHRLEASVYGIEARQVRRDLEQCKWDIVHLDVLSKMRFMEGVQKEFTLIKIIKMLLAFWGVRKCYPYSRSPLNFY